MLIKYKSKNYFIEDSHKEFRLEHDLGYLKKQLVYNKIYPFLINNKNEILCLFAKFKLKKVKNNKIIVDIRLFDTEYISIFEEITKEIGFAVNPIIALNGKLVALGITPYPSEIDKSSE